MRWDNIKIIWDFPEETKPQQAPRARRKVASFEIKVSLSSSACF